MASKTQRYTAPKQSQAFGPYGSKIQPRAWSEEERATVAKLFLEGLSPREIARKLQDRTPGMVTGQLSRLGLQRAESTRATTREFTARRGGQAAMKHARTFK